MYRISDYPRVFGTDAKCSREVRSQDDYADALRRHPILAGRVHISGRHFEGTPKLFDEPGALNQSISIEDTTKTCMPCRHGQSIARMLLEGSPSVSRQDTKEEHELQLNRQATLANFSSQSHTCCGRTLRLSLYCASRSPFSCLFVCCPTLLVRHVTVAMYDGH